MSGITKRAAFWVAFALLSAICAVLAWRYFPEALPLVNLDVKMSRDQALEQAATIADRLHLVAPEARRAAAFTHDGSTQNYVELEAGGRPAFTRLLSGEVYAPYRWEVRLFKPRETAEVHVRFKPDGSVYGFARKVPEDEPGPSLDAVVARTIAEARARSDWAIDFGPYRLLEQSRVERPNGRVDHAFVYEREDVKLGDARIRMRLTVSGDALSEITHYVHVPEAFGRRFQEMRSDNKAIAYVASLAAGVLYGLGGCIIGVLWLMRQRRLLWKPALVAGGVVAGLNALAILANAPQAWFGYDTAQSTGVFWGQQIGIAALVLVAGGLGLTLVFTAAESLSRRAFAGHPQLWRVWSREAAPTPAVLGRTLGGYLFVPIELALISGFYFVTNRYFGWWQPSESLSDPNILGSALPALAPIGMALQAGFMEECLFRAVPLSLAALIGERFGCRRALLGAALVLQALVFAAAHANYPGFPAYSRLVELFVPAFIWGLIFLRFGLVPTIILHAVFDLVLMAIPVFLVQGPGAELNQALVVGAGLAPLAVVLWRRLWAGRWLALPESLANRAWQPGIAKSPLAAHGPRAAAGAWTANMQRALPLLALCGLLAFIITGSFHADAPPVAIDRAQAEAIADAALKERRIALGPEWKRFAAVRLASEDAAAWPWNKFVWREAGQETYRKLIGDWLAPPLWEVRYARFTGADVADRAEEWRITIQGNGQLRQVGHRLPERHAGARLAEEDARALARRTIAERFALDLAALHEVEVKQDPRPARIDWRFTYADPRVTVGKGGEARVMIDLAGDEVVGYGRYVFIPDTWYRAERDRAGRLSVLRIVVALGFAILAIAALISATVAWTRAHFDRRAFWSAGTLLLGAAIVNAVNQWPQLAMRLQTAEPVVTQVALAAGGQLFGAVLTALLGGMFAGVGAFAAREHVTPGLDARALWLRGAAVALAIVGVDVAIGAITPDLAPLWPKYDAENAWLPWLARLLGAVNVLPVIGLALVALRWLDRITAGWTRRRILAAVLLMLTHATIAAVSADQWFDIVASGVVGGAVSTLLFATVLRYDLRVVPPLIGVYVSAALIAQAAQKGTLQAAFLGAIGVAATLAVAWAATRYILTGGPAPGHAVPVAADVPAAAVDSAAK
ncbi:MAG: CPBP family intramembrane metalloprotease [Betaproteobacteria bacterium]|nr:MAG: CPBP family intramembrane metalloprotease [Betaproteobacteria bacterium]